MLPMHGGYGYSGRRGGKTGISSSAIAAVVLGAISCLLALGYYSSHSHAASLQRTVAQLQASNSQVTELLNHQKSLGQHMEYEFHTLQRRTNDMTRELQQQEHMLQMKNQEKEAFVAAEAQMQAVIKQLQEQLEYEQAIVKVHIEKIAELEKAHNAREADWRELSKTWAKFEAEATKENSRLLLEVAKATQAAGTNLSPPPAPIPHPLPETEPKIRADVSFDTHVNIPNEEQYVHHYKLAEEYIKRHKDVRVPRISQILSQAAGMQAAPMDAPKLSHEHAGGMGASTEQPQLKSDSASVAHEHLGGMEGGHGVHNPSSGGGNVADRRLPADSEQLSRLQSPSHVPIPTEPRLLPHHTPRAPEPNTNAPPQTPHTPGAPQVPLQQPSPPVVDPFHHSQIYDDDPHHWVDDMHFDQLDHYWIHDNWDSHGTVQQPHHDAYVHPGQQGDHWAGQQHAPDVQEWRNQQTGRQGSGDVARGHMQAPDLLPRHGHA